MQLRASVFELAYLNKAKVSIIIVTWNSKDAVRACLRSLESLDKSQLSLETIVVDNHSKDGTAEWLLSEGKTLKTVGLRLLFNERNEGLSAATEQAYKIAQGDWILLCNPDVEFTNDFLDMVSFARSQVDYSMLAAEMINEDGSLQRVVVRRFPTVARVFFAFSVIGFHLDKFLLGNYFLDDYTYARTVFSKPVSPVDQPGASFLLVSRDAIEKIGGIFSEEFPIWWNDVDLAKRADRKRIRRGIMPGVIIPHEQGHTAKTMSRPNRRYIFCLALIRYCRKWKMHPHLVRSLFFLDGLISLIIGWPLWGASLSLGGGLREGLGYSLSQVRSVLTA
jgi:N-acetylglucosaminyl-diphospho-decaprenol L-rhamnosyltransferase